MQELESVQGAQIPAAELKKNPSAHVRQIIGFELEQALHPESQYARILTVELTVTKAYPTEYCEARVLHKVAELQAAQ